jgi:hypothetical protein
MVALKDPRDEAMFITVRVMRTRRLQSTQQSGVDAISGRTPSGLGMLAGRPIAAALVQEFGHGRKDLRYSGLRTTRRAQATPPSVHHESSAPANTDP